MEFERDAEKELVETRKHKVVFAEAVETFFDTNGFQLIDRKHSKGESRFYWVGKTQGRVLTTWFTKRGQVIRIIGSAQWRQFRRLYNETTQAN